MTPKQKAKELVEKYISASVVVEDGENHYHPQPFSLAKQCALIAVDEVIYVAQNECHIQIPHNPHETVEYWEEVKQEIINL